MRFIIKNHFSFLDLAGSLDKKYNINKKTLKFKGV